VTIEASSQQLLEDSRKATVDRLIPLLTVRHGSKSFADAGWGNW
jgi:hypothetical protein